MRRISTAVCAGLLAAATAQPAAAQRIVDLPVRDRALQGSPTEVWSRGAASGQDWEQFNGIASMAFDREDNLYVVDAQNYRVLRFDARGQFVRQYGAQGGGPGEFNLPLGVAVATDGAVIVADAMGGYEVFNGDGSHRRNVGYPEDVRMVQQIAAHPQGGIVARSTAMPGMDAGGGLRLDPDDLPAPVVRIFQQPVMDKAPLAVLHQHTEPPPEVRTSGGAGDQRVMVRMGGGAQFTPAFSWGVLPAGGVATLNGADYAITLTDRDGQAVTTLRRPLQPRPVTDRLKATAQDRERERLASGGDAGGVRVMVTADGGGSNTSFATGGGAAGGGGELTKDQIEARVAEMTFAEVVPAARRLLTDPFGRIWVERYAEDLSTPGPVDLLTADGRYIGTLSGIVLPRAVSRTGLAAWVERDEFDVERVVVRRLPDAWR